MRSTRLSIISKAQHPFLWGAAAIVTAGLGYYVFVRLTGLGIPCPIQTVTGLACPGCGISHLCMALLEGHIAEAAAENLAVALLAPIWVVVVAAVCLHRRQIRGVTRTRPVTWLSWTSIALLLIFGVARNLPGLEFLLPSYLR